MKIIIVGAGLGALTAALPLTRSGHEVVIYEHKQDFKPLGHGINIRPNASRWLVRWGVGKEVEDISQELPGFSVRSLTTGNVVMHGTVLDASEHPDWGTWRHRLSQVLHDRAKEAGAEYVFGATVVDVIDDVGADRASVMFADGSSQQADLVLVADGVRSRLRPKLLSYLNLATDPVVQPVTLYSPWVPALDESTFVNKPEWERLTNQNNMNGYMGKDKYVVTRWDSKRRELMVLCGVRSERERQQVALWDEEGDVDYLRETFADCCPEVRTALQVAPNAGRWKLAEAPPLPCWTGKGGRVALLGDSAHAMLPNVTQGYSQIVEDIAVLDWLLKTYPQVRVPALTSVWHRIRQPRVQKIMSFARYTFQMAVGDEVPEKNDTNANYDTSMKNTVPNPDAPYHSPEFMKWALDYDCVEDAKKYIDSNRIEL